MFKLVIFTALLALVAAAPAPKPGYLASAPIVSAPLAYSAYAAPFAYSGYVSPYAYSAYTSPYAPYSAYAPYSGYAW